MENKVNFLKKLLVVYFSFRGEKRFKDGLIKCPYKIIFILGMFNWIYILGGCLVVIHIFNLIFSLKNGYTGLILSFLLLIIINIFTIYFLNCKYINSKK